MSIPGSRVKTLRLQQDGIADADSCRHVVEEAGPLELLKLRFTEAHDLTYLDGDSRERGPSVCGVLGSLASIAEASARTVCVNILPHNGLDRSSRRVQGKREHEGHRVAR